MLTPYIRRSRGDEEKISIEDQRRAIREWAERAGVELADEVVERGVSGHSAWRDRELGEVVARCERGEVEGVVVAYFSRLTREKLSATWEVLESLEPYRRVFVREGRDLRPGEQANLVEAVNGFQANAEWHVLRGNLTRGKHVTWESGGFVGVPPAGYALEDGVLVKNGHADTLAQAFHARAGGGSWSEVARILTAAAVPTSRGETRWSTQACRALARNRLYKGVHRCTCGCGSERVRAELAVVTPSVWDQAQPAKAPTAGRKDPGARLLSGLLFCGGCGQRLVHGETTVGGKRYAFYRCRSGLRCESHASVSATLAEALVVETVIDYAEFMEPTVGHDADTERLASLEHQRDDAQRRVAAFIAAADPLDPGYADRLAELRDALNVSESALLEERESSVRNVSGEELRRDWETASIDVQRRFLRLLLKGVTVHKGRGQLQERVEINLKTIISRGWNEAS